MNYRELEIIANELNVILNGGVIQKIKEDSNGDFYLSVYNNSSTYNVLICVNPPYPRVHLTKSKPEKTTPRHFSMYLRKHISGKIIQKVSAYNLERIIEFELDDKKLVAEIFPRGGNVYVLKRDNRVEYSLFDVDFDMYHVETSHEPPEVNEPEIPDNEMYNEMLDNKYSSLIENQSFKTQKKRALNLLKKERKRVKRKINSIQKDAEKIQNADKYVKYGDLIKTYFYDIKKGMKQYGCFDHETGNQIVIPLDEKLTPDENMTEYYKKAKKLKQGQKYVNANFERAQEQLKIIEEFTVSINETDNSSEIEELIKQMDKNKYLKRVAGNIAMKKGRAQSKNKSPFRYFTNEEQDEIYIGRNDEENDKLTFTFAKGRDYWFHVADYAGSHVVVPLKNRETEISQATLNDAALLAVHYSKAKGNDASVNYTKRKYVNKSKGMPKGMVTLSGFKTVFVKYDMLRIRDLMEMNK